MQEILNFFYSHYFLCTIWLITFFLFVFNILKVFFFNTISNDILINLINRNFANLIDLRNESDFKLGHIINSINISSCILDSKLSNNLINVSKNRPLILICNNGRISLNLAKKFYNYGFKKVYILREGIIGWKKENLPLITKKNIDN